MATPNPYQSTVRFGEYELDLQAGTLTKNGMRIRCQEQPLQVLAALLERPGQLVTREELRRRVWPQDTFVDFDHALNTAIKKIRAALNDDADAPRYIETVPRRGYRFASSVTPSVGTDLPSLLKPSSPVATGMGIAEPLWHLHPAILSGAAILLLSALGIYYANGHRIRASSNPSNPERRMMVAVLPFVNMSSDPNQEFFSDGMTEETITRLGRQNSKRIGVIARTSTMKYKNARKSVEEVGRELHADYVVEGSVRREGSRVRVTAQLIHSADQSPAWTREFDYDSGDTLTVESDVAGKIATQVASQLGEPAPTHLVYYEDAYDSRLRALAQTGIHSEQGLQLILTTIEQATKEDAHCAQAYAELAHVYERGANLGFLPPNHAYSKAREAALHSIQLDPNLSESHVFMADALLTVDYDWEGARMEIEKALALNANDPMAHEWEGIFLDVQGKTDEAIAEMSRALELDPLNAERLANFGSLLSTAGRYKESETNLLAAIQLDPASEHSHGILMHLYDKEGRQPEAVAEWSTIFSLRNQQGTVTQLNAIYRKSGYEAAQRFAFKKELDYLKLLSKSRYISPLRFAAMYAHLGDKEQTLYWVEQAYQQHDVSLPCLARDEASFGLVKDEARFKAVMQKVRFPNYPATN